MVTWLLHYIGRQVSSLFVSLVSHLIRTKMGSLVRLPTTISVHLAELEMKVKDMPFIYKDLEGSVLNDFVDLDIQSVDLKTLRLVDTRTIFTIDNAQRLRDA